MTRASAVSKLLSRAFGVRGVGVIDEVVKIAAKIWCRCLQLYVVDKVPTKVVYMVSDADLRAEDEAVPSRERHR
jgi:hypothetical protein